jgi:uncharacterized membrane protein
MVSEKEILSWKQEGIITEKQAKKMLEDVKNSTKEKHSNLLITILSVLGVVLLAVGFLSFIVSNWNSISDGVKLLLFMFLTFASYFLGYMLKYKHNTFPKTGSALFFLGALLFGLTLFLISQTFHIDSKGSSLLFIWLLGILPLVYVLKNKPLASLAGLLFLIWGLFYVFEDLGLNQTALFFSSFSILYLLILYLSGTLHYTNEKYLEIGKTYRTFSIQGILFFIFFSTFSYSEYAYTQTTPTETIPIFLLLLFIVVVLLLFQIFLVKSKEVMRFETPLILVLIVLTSIKYFFPKESDIYIFGFNVLFIVLLIALYYSAFKKEQMALINIAFFWTGIYIFVKYIDWFWDVFPTYVFFTITGLLLVFGGFFIENKRKQIKKQLQKQ